MEKILDLFPLSGLKFVSGEFLTVQLFFMQQMLSFSAFLFYTVDAFVACTVEPAC